MRSQTQPEQISNSILSGDIRHKVDGIWDTFWSGGISNPLEVLEQLTYLLFIRRLDEIQTIEENKANRTGRQVERKIFPEGKDKQGQLWEDLRWSRFKQKNPAEMFAIMRDRIFPFLQELENNNYVGGYYNYAYLNQIYCYQLFLQNQ